MEKSSFALRQENMTCKKCKKSLNTQDFIVINQNRHYYCFDCNLTTIWSNGTIFDRTQLNLLTIQNILRLYLLNKSKQEAYIDMEEVYQNRVAKNTISKYFDLFSEIIKKYYKDAHKNWT